MSDAREEINPYAPPASMTGEVYDAAKVFGSPDALHRVASGLNLVYWGIAIILLSTIGGIFIVAAVGLAGGLLVLSGIVAGILVGLVGRVFCLSVPAATHAREIIYAAVAFDIVAVAMTLVRFVMLLPGWCSDVANLLSFIATVLFVIFMKRVASFINQPGLADQAQGLITMGMVLFVLWVAVLFGAALLGKLVGLLGFVLVVFVLVIFLRYVRLLVNLRKEILGAEQDR